MIKYFLVIVVISFGYANSSRAAWYARFENDKIKDCQLFNESLDESWRGFNQKFGSCDLRTGSGSMVDGYLFNCGPNNNQILFRTKEDCELIKKHLAGGAEVAPEAFAPKGIKNPGGWVVAIDGCLTKAATKEGLAKLGLQRLNDYCVCAANKVASHTEQELEADKSNAADMIVETAKDWTRRRSRSPLWVTMAEPGAQWG